MLNNEKSKHTTHFCVVFLIFLFTTHTGQADQLSTQQLFSDPAYSTISKILARIAPNNKETIRTKAKVYALFHTLYFVTSFPNEKLQTALFTLFATIATIQKKWITTCTSQEQALVAALYLFRADARTILESEPQHIRVIYEPLIDAFICKLHQILLTAITPINWYKGSISISILGSCLIVLYMAWSTKEKLNETIGATLTLLTTTFNLFTEYLNQYRNSLEKQYL